MNRIFRPVLVLVVAGVVLGWFAFGGRKAGIHPKSTAKTSPASPAAPKGTAAPSDAKAALDNLINLLNKDDAAGLRAQFAMPCYMEGRKIEDDQTLNAFIEKAVQQPHAFALESAVQTTAIEAGLPPEAEEVLTSNDTILVADLRQNGEPASRIFIFRKTASGLKVLAILKTPER
jgi:hypothetical protein